MKYILNCASNYCTIFRYIISGSNDGHIIVWDDISGSETLNINCQSPVSSMTKLPVEEGISDLFVYFCRAPVDSSDTVIKVYRMTFTDQVQGECILQIPSPIT